MTAKSQQPSKPIIWNKSLENKKIYKIKQDIKIVKLNYSWVI